MDEVVEYLRWIFIVAGVQTIFLFWIANSPKQTVIATKNSADAPDRITADQIDEIISALRSLESDVTFLRQRAFPPSIEEEADARAARRLAKQQKDDS